MTSVLLLLLLVVVVVVVVVVVAPADPHSLSRWSRALWPLPGPAASTVILM